MKKSLLSKIIGSCSLLLLPTLAWAAPKDESYIYYSVILGLIIMIIAVMLLVLIAVFQIKHVLFSQQQATKGNQVDEFNFWEWLGGLKPISREKELLLHDDFDGIKELNNPVPVWFNVLFYGTIAFGIVYLLVYHSWNMAPLSGKEYELEVKAAMVHKEKNLVEEGSKIDENSVVVVTDAKELEKGKGVYINNCAMCHGKDGEGKVGPNLTDNFWKNGKGSVNDVFKVIKYGVPDKGMVPWEKSLTPTQIQNVTSYILSLKGTNPANAKAPEGEEVK